MILRVLALKILISVVVFLPVVSYAEASVSYPVLKDCASDVIKKVNSFPDTIDVDISLARFNGGFDSHSSLYGYLELSSGSFDIEALTEYAGGLTLSCRATHILPFKKDKSSIQKEFFMYLEGARNAGRAVYIQDFPDEIKIYVVK